MEIRLTRKTANKTVLELNIRGNFGLNIIAIKHDDMITTDIYPTTRLAEDDTITVIGSKKAIQRFEDFLNKQ